MHINLLPVDLGKKDILFNLYQLYKRRFKEICSNILYEIITNCGGLFRNVKIGTLYVSKL